MDENRLETTLRRFARERLPSCQGAGKDSIRLIKPATGVNSLVRLVERDGLAVCAVRVFQPWRIWQVKRRLAAEEILRRHDLPAPRMLEFQPGSLLRRPSILAEEALPGRHLVPGEWTGDLSRQFAATLSRFHAIANARHGSVRKLSSQSYFAATMRRIRHRLHGVKRRGDKAARAQIPEALGWFLKWEAAFGRMRRFELIHDKLNPGNVLWQEDERRFALLDFDTLQFGCRVKDLVQACHEVLFDSPPDVAAFLKAYRADLPREELDWVDRAWPFFDACHYLSDAATNLKRAEKREAGRGGRKFKSAWNTLLGIMNEGSPPTLRP